MCFPSYQEVLTTTITNNVLGTPSSVCMCITENSIKPYMYLSELQLHTNATVCEFTTRSSEL